MSMPEWTKVAAGLYRVPVPGGWLYGAGAGGSTSVTFVPHPPMQAAQPTPYHGPISVGDWYPNGSSAPTYANTHLYPRLAQQQNYAAQQVHAAQQQNYGGDGSLPSGYCG